MGAQATSWLKAQRILWACISICFSLTMMLALRTMPCLTMGMLFMARLTEGDRPLQRRPDIPVFMQILEEMKSQPRGYQWYHLDKGKTRKPTLVWHTQCAIYYLDTLVKNTYESNVSDLYQTPF